MNVGQLILGFGMDMLSVSWSSFGGKGQMELEFELLMTTRLCTLVGIRFFGCLMVQMLSANEDWALGMPMKVWLKWVLMEIRLGVDANGNWALGVNGSEF
ncbi:hypothetical protein QL285_021070 [Trifolium repens]|nr:hypothetical protein QL285_021070 [Trifolium repens]